MQPLTELYDPLRFLIIEVQKQLDSVTLFLETGDLRQAENGQKRVDYIDNYHVNLLNRAATYLGEQTDKDIRITVQSYEHINHGLKSLSRQLQAIIFQAKQSSTALKLLRKKNVFRALNDLQVGLELIEPAIESDGSMLAIDICRLKVHIDKRCDQQLEKYKARLKKGQQTEALLHASFIIRDVSDMGEALLRIGEGIISANMGQMIQIDRYHSLEATLTALQLNPQEDDLTIRAMGETKSGCTISGVMTAEESEGQMLAVFKEGDKAKLKEEKTGIESWHEKFPGIAPQVYSYHKSGNKAALLFEYLTGETFDKLLLQKNRKTLKAALNRLFETLTQIWEETRADQPYPANFMAQLRKRLKDVYEVHPEFQSPSVSINGVKSPTLEALVDEAETLEAELPCPLGVYIHGDFNLDNIIYDPVDNDINFIDLHRSEYLDFVQDLSVLMVSAYRLSNFDPQVRKLIAQTMQAIYEFGQDYAEHIDDTSYHLRMALGLSRSFLTSTRFVLDKQHAKAMHFRGRYLIEQVIRLTEAERMTYRIPKEIFHD
ncbi:MAG: phosphotransferase family protein [Hydrogenovibrio sp.]